MTRRYVIWIGLVSIAAAVVLNTSLQTRQQQDRLAEINREIAKEEERIRVLTAEWHSLKTPGRLEALARRHLREYETLKPMQLASLNDIPERLAPAPAPVPELGLAATEQNDVQETAEQAVEVAATEVMPVPRPRPARRPAAQVARRAAPAENDSVGRLIAQAETPAARPDDGIRAIIEREPAQNGVLWASVDGLR